MLNFHAMTLRLLKLGKFLAISTAVLIGLLVTLSVLIIDRGDPEIIGSISADEVRAVRRAARNQAILWCLHFIPRGEFSVAWHYANELYSYQIVKIQVDDDKFVLLSTNRPHAPFNFYSAQRVGGDWVASMNLPML